MACCVVANNSVDGVVGVGQGLGHWLSFGLQCSCAVQVDPGRGYF